MLEKLNDKLTKILRPLRVPVMILLIFIALYSFQLFFSGLHNIDNGYNFKGSSDTGSDYIARPTSWYYIHGYNQVELAFLMNTIVMFSLGMLIRGEN